VDAYFILTALQYLKKSVACGAAKQHKSTDRTSILTSYDVSSPDKPVSYASGGLSLILRSESAT
jgi:hypothetical protein